MNLENKINEFNKFVGKYDLEYPKMRRKLEHSYRVMSNADKITKSLNLSEKEIEIANIIGLLHDIGHFETIKVNDILKDNKKIDHGDLGVEILEKNNYIRKFVEDDKYDNIILKAIKNHNKFKIEEGLSKQELLFAKIIRDADKLDIFYEGAEMFWTQPEEIEEINKSKVTDKVFDAFKNNCLIDRKNIETKADGIISFIGFIFDINFKYDFQVIKNENYINRILDKFDFRNEITASQMTKVRQYANEYIERQYA